MDIITGRTPSSHERQRRRGKRRSQHCRWQEHITKPTTTTHGALRRHGAEGKRAIGGGGVAVPAGRTHRGRQRGWFDRPAEHPPTSRSGPRAHGWRRARQRKKKQKKRIVAPSRPRPSDPPCSEPCRGPARPRAASLPPLATTPCHQHTRPHVQNGTYIRCAQTRMRFGIKCATLGGF